MSDYRVVWEIDVDADDPVQAAMIALGIQRRQESIATVFEVTYKRDLETVVVDLSQPRGSEVVA